MLSRSLALLAVLPLAAFAAADVPATLSGLVHGLTDWTSIPAADASSSTLPIVQPFADQIDQNQPNPGCYMAAFNQTCLAQSFQQTNDNISGAGIMLYTGVGTTDNVTLQVWTNLPNAGGTMIAEASAVGTAGTWVDVYWAGVPVTPGTTYFLVFTGNMTLGVYGDTANPYPYGCVYANDGYGQFPGYDYTFRTYYDDALSLDRTTWGEVKAAF